MKNDMLQVAASDGSTSADVLAALKPSSSAFRLSEPQKPGAIKRSLFDDFRALTLLIDWPHWGHW